MMATLLMTGTINSGYFGNVETKVSDIEDRIKQYYTTIEKYIVESNFDKIVFAENSKYPFDFAHFDALSKKYGKQFEYLSVDTDVPQTQAKGKSYGEAHLISEAVKRSELIKPEKTFYKVTGRVFVSNVNKLINNKPSCQFITRNHSKWCLTVFFKANTDVFKRCLTDIEDLCSDYIDGSCIEAIYYQQLKHEKVDCFSRYPDLTGIVGSTGTPYNCPKRNLIKKNIMIKLGFYSYRNTLFMPLVRLLNKIRQR